MAQVVSPTEFSVPLTINVQRTNLTAEQFFMLCQENELLRFELTAQQELIIMPLVGGLDGMRNARLSSHLWDWADKDGTGMAFGSNVGVTFPNGAVRSPDAFWIEQRQWDALTKEQKETFAPVCPIFVVELRSQAEQVPTLHEKMQEYLDPCICVTRMGLRLSWCGLLNRKPAPSDSLVPPCLYPTASCTFLANSCMTFSTLWGSGPGATT